MSAAVRQELADAASELDGVTVTPYYRQIARPGQGLVRYARTDYPNSLGGVDTWQVVVQLPDAQDQAEQWLEENLAALVAALTPHITVSIAQPVQLQLGADTLPALIVEGTRETEE